jgi:hypothetical protein
MSLGRRNANAIADCLEAEIATRVLGLKVPDLLVDLAEVG